MDRTYKHIPIPHTHTHMAVLNSYLTVMKQRKISYENLITVKRRFFQKCYKDLIKGNFGNQIKEEFYINMLCVFLCSKWNKSIIHQAKNER